MLPVLGVLLMRTLKRSRIPLGRLVSLLLTAEA